MAIHATERLDNVRARLGVWFTGLTLTGSPELVLEGQERAQNGTAAPFLRMSLVWLASEARGHIDADTRTDEEFVLVAVDLFWPTTTADTYAIDRVAAEVKYALRALSLDFLDYATDPVTPPSISQHPIRVLEVPRVRTLPTSDGFQRRRVEATARWFTQHS